MSITELPARNGVPGAVASAPEPFRHEPPATRQWQLEPYARESDRYAPGSAR